MTMTVLHPSRTDDRPALPGRLVFVTSRSSCSPHLARRTVRAVIDGMPVDLDWGRTEVEVPAGRHRVALQVGGRHAWGHVADAVPVAAGASVEVYYRAPALPHLGGALGPVPQSTRGLRALAAGVAALLTTVLSLAVLLTALL